MGEAKRRKALDVNYGVRPCLNDWLLLPPNLTEDKDRVIKNVIELVKFEAARELFLSFDSEAVIPLPKEESRLPHDWPYSMRQLEAHPDACEWINIGMICAKMFFREDSDLLPLMHLRLHQWLAISVEMAGVQLDYCMDSGYENETDWNEWNVSVLRRAWQTGRQETAIASASSHGCACAAKSDDSDETLEEPAIAPPHPPLNPQSTSSSPNAIAALSPDLTTVITSNNPKE